MHSHCRTTSHKARQTSKFKLLLSFKHHARLKAKTNHIASQMDITNPSAHESQYVHDVYEHIAPHFSQTRYKPWPLISNFLQSLPPGSVGVDLGCGNGKYLHINPNVYIVASDRSSNLVSLARESTAQASSISKSDKDVVVPKCDVAVADLLDHPHPSHRFDFAISIAVVHHFASRERRIAAVETILDVLNTTGKAMVYVWALEQKNSRRGWDEGDTQDVFVPWVMKASQAGKKEEPKESKEDAEETLQRYYHLYKKGELEEDVVSAGGVVVDSGYERDNWWVIMRRGDVE